MRERRASSRSGEAPLRAVVSLQGGAIVGAWRESAPLLRAYAPGASGEFDVTRPAYFRLCPSAIA